METKQDGRGNEYIFVDEFSVEKRLAFSSYGGVLLDGPSCSQQAQICPAPQLQQPANKPLVPSGIQQHNNNNSGSSSSNPINNSGSYFVGMAMGMSMASDPQHHPMGSMNGLSYSHGT